MSQKPTYEELFQKVNDLENNLLYLKQRDVSMQQQLEKAKRFESIINHSPVSVSIAKAGKAWPIEFISDNFQRFGYSSEDFYSGHVQPKSIVHPDDIERIEAEEDQYDREGRETYILEYRIITKSGETRWLRDIIWQRFNDNSEVEYSESIVVDITELKQAAAESEILIKELKTALSEVRTLRSLLPICAHCKKIRDDKGFWQKLENYFQKHSDVKFTHGFCPDCMKELYPEVYSESQEIVIEDT